MKKLTSEKRFMYICLIILLVFTAICIAPFLLMFAASITDEQTLLKEGYRFWPSSVSFDTYRYLWAKRETIGRAYIISILVTFVGTAVGHQRVDRVEEHGEMYLHLLYFLLCYSMVV